MDSSLKFKTIDEYHAAFSPPVSILLDEMRRIIHEAAPKAFEVISYNMPAFKHKRVLVYYAGYKGHIGFYPTSSPIRVFSKELSVYKTSKGAVQFPLDRPLPADLIKRMVEYRIQEEGEREKLKS